MSASPDDLLFEVLQQGRALPDVSARQALGEGARALADEALPLLDARDVCFRIRRALEAPPPLSLIRLGDGEALSLAQGLVLTPEEALARGPFLPQHGVPIPSEEARRALLEAVRTADLVGIPLSRHANCQPLLAECLAAADVRLEPERATHSLVNYELWKMGLLERLLPGRQVLVVGGPAEAFAAVLRRYGAVVAGVVAPVAGVRDIDAVVRRSIQHEFDIALVSAGVAACAICPRISRALGKVALDFGACADEIAQGEPWRVAPPGTGGPLEEAELRRIFTAAEGPYPTHIAWDAAELRRTGDAATLRCTARWEARGTFRRRSFIAKVGRVPDRLRWEAAVLQAVSAARAFAAPVVHVCDAGLLAMSDLGGSPLMTAAPKWWRAAARALAVLHTRSRVALRSLPASRRFDWKATRRRVHGAVEAASAAAGGLGAEGRVLQAECEAAWMRCSGLTPVGTDLILAHGDLSPENLLVPDALGERLGAVGWGDAGEHLPALDLAALAAGLTPAMRSLVLAEYLRGREASGWPCGRDDLLHDFSVMARLRLIALLAEALRRLGESGAPDPGVGPALGLAKALREITAPAPV